MISLTKIISYDLKKKNLVLIKFKTYSVYVHDDNHNSGLSLK